MNSLSHPFSRAFAFAAGAILVHCGTTTFTVASGDAGGLQDGGAKEDAPGFVDGSSSSHSSSGSGASGSGSSSSEEALGASCERETDCASGVCCVDVNTFKGSCGAATAVCNRACKDGSDCISPAVCCVEPALSTTVHACTSETTCMGVEGRAQLCSSSTECTSGTCQVETCMGMSANVCSWTKACDSGSGSSCAPFTCTSEYSGRCGTNLSNGCGGTIDCMCPSSLGTPGMCIQAGNGAGTCPP